MFCTHCGKKVSDSQRFCGFCGNSVNYDDSALITHYEPNSAEFNDLNISLIREKELEKIDSLISFFSAEQNSFDEYDSEGKKINELNRVNAKLALIWSIILFSISFLGLLRSLAYGYNVNYYLNQFLLCGPISAGLLILFFSLNRRRRARLENAISKYCYYLEYLSKYYYNYKNCPIGIEYSNPSNLREIKKVIDTGRANSIEEASNILVAAAYRNNKRDFSHMAAEYLVSIHRLPSNTIVLRGARFFDSTN